MSSANQSGLFVGAPKAMACHLFMGLPINEVSYVHRRGLKSISYGRGSREWEYINYAKPVPAFTTDDVV